MVGLWQLQLRADQERESEREIKEAKDEREREMKETMEERERLEKEVKVEREREAKEAREGGRGAQEKT